MSFEDPNYNHSDVDPFEFWALVGEDKAPAVFVEEKGGGLFGRGEKTAKINARLICFGFCPVFASMAGSMTTGEDYYKAERQARGTV